MQVDTKVIVRTGAQAEPDPFLRAVTGAVHAQQALTTRVTIFPNRTGATESVAVLAVDTELLRSPLQNRIARADAEQAAEGAEVLTPEPMFDPLQQHNGQKNQESEKPQCKNRLMKCHEVITEQRVSSFDGRREKRHLVGIKEIKDLIEAIVVRGVYGESKRTQKNSQGVKKAQQLNAEDRSRSQGDQQVVLEPTPSR